METYLEMVVQKNTSLHLIDIEAKLQELWNEGLGKDRIRACLFNLLIYSKKGGKNLLYEKLIQSVISKFPCRVIWIKENLQEEKLDTSVKGAALSTSIFCEIIEIEFGLSYKERVSSLVLPHIVPDLPFYLLWTEDSSEKDIIFSALAPIATKIIFDTSYIDNLQNFYLNTLQLSKKFPGTISDLNWSYIKGWRHLFAAVFNTNDSLIPLMNSKIIRISYHEAIVSEIKHNEIRAAYFQGWLSSCFQWRFLNLEKEGSVFRITYRHPTHDVTVLLFPKKGDECGFLPPGAILSCDIESEERHYSFKREVNSRQIFFQYSDATLCELPQCYYLPGISEGQEILEEIFYKSEETHYRNTLEIVSQIPWSKT